MLKLTSLSRKKTPGGYSVMRSKSHSIELFVDGVRTLGTETTAHDSAVIRTRRANLKQAGHEKLQLFTMYSADSCDSRFCGRAC
jgi:hypothetical protein